MVKGVNRLTSTRKDLTARSLEKRKTPRLHAVSLETYLRAHIEV
jgi:hypothetical protein